MGGILISLARTKSKAGKLAHTFMECRILISTFNMKQKDLIKLNS